MEDFNKEMSHCQNRIQSLNDNLKKVEKLLLKMMKCTKMTDTSLSKFTSKKLTREQRNLVNRTWKSLRDFVVRTKNMNQKLNLEENTDE